MMRFRPSHFPRIVYERILAGSLIDEWLQGTWLNSRLMGNLALPRCCGFTFPERRFHVPVEWICKQWLTLPPARVYVRPGPTVRIEKPSVSLIYFDCFFAFSLV